MEFPIYNPDEKYYKELSRPEITIFPAPVISIETKVSGLHLSPNNKNIRMKICIKCKKYNPIKEIVQQYKNIPFD